MLNPAPLIHPILSIGDVRGGDLQPIHPFHPIHSIHPIHPSKSQVMYVWVTYTFPILIVSLSLSYPILSIGDVRGGDLHRERALQERGARSLQQKSRLREPFPGGIEIHFDGRKIRCGGIEIHFDGVGIHSASLFHVNVR